MRTEVLEGALLSVLLIASLITPLLLLSPSPVHAALTPHDPIYIDGNAGFTPANGVVAGSGTESEPYIIENWDIDASSGNGIEIKNTTAHFVIRNCYVHDGRKYGNYGIYFENVGNGEIENLTSENNWYGIYFWLNSTNNIIRASAASNNYGYGICLRSSPNNKVDNCIIENNGTGILLWWSSNTNLRNNLLSNNQYNLGIKEAYYHDIDNSNKINGKPVYYVVGQENLTFDGNVMDIGYLGLVSCDNIQVKNLNMSNNYQGVLLAGTSHSTIMNSSFLNNWEDGVYLSDSSNNIIENCYTASSGPLGSTGIGLHSISNNNIIKNCTVSNQRDGKGISLAYSSNNRIENCIVENNEVVGITFLNGSNNNIVTNSNISNNGFYGGSGIGFGLSSENNHIYHNNFENNTTQADDAFSNYWDDGYPSGGNYWSDYTGGDVYRGVNQDRLGSDGIGDTPYDIPGGNRDRYPLVNPWPRGTAVFKLENLYTVRLDVNLYLENGSKLVGKFYTYSDSYQGENIVWSGTTPDHVSFSKTVPHPQGASYPQAVAVEKARLDLTTDNTENVISTIASFTVTKDDIWEEIPIIYMEWPFAPPDRRNHLMAEISDKYLQWPFAPP